MHNQPGAENWYASVARSLQKLNQKRVHWLRSDGFDQKIGYWTNRLQVFEYIPAWLKEFYFSICGIGQEVHEYSFFWKRSCIMRPFNQCSQKQKNKKVFGKSQNLTLFWYFRAASSTQHVVERLFPPEIQLIGETIFPSFQNMRFKTVVHFRSVFVQLPKWFPDICSRVAFVDPLHPPPHATRRQGF